MNNYYKIITFLLVIILAGCQKEDDYLDLKNNNLDKSNRNIVKTVKPGDIPQIMDFIKSKSNSNMEFSLKDPDKIEQDGKSGNYEYAYNDDLVITSVLATEIKQVTNSFGKSSYTFSMIEHTDKMGTYFLNLVVKEYLDTYYLYIVKYEPNLLWLNGYNSGLFQFSNFAGNLYFYDQQGNFKSMATMTNGVSSNIEYDAPCPPDESDPTDPTDPVNDGSGSGTGTGGGGCEYEVSVSINQCGGSDSGTEHTPESCGGDGSGGVVTTTFTWSCEENQIAPPQGENFFDPPCSGGGSGGGPSDNNCVGVSPCEFPLELDENCDCVEAEAIEIGTVGVVTPKPCPGDPITRMNLAPQKGSSGTKGGLYGCTRYGGTCTSSNGRNKTHKGIDIKNAYGMPIYAMFDGFIYSTKYHKKAGYNTRIQSTVNGETILISYFHLQENNRILQSSSGESLVSVQAGDIIGYQGDSGNLKNAIFKKGVDSHVHIEIRKHDGSNSWGYSHFNSVDPRSYFSTEIDDNGNTTINENCN